MFRGRGVTGLVFGEGVLLRYLGRRFMGTFLLLFIGVSLALQGLSILAESGEILAGEGASFFSLVRFTWLNLPQLAAQLPPFTVLIAALMTFATLNQRSEITVMKAVGMSPFRIVRPLVVAAAVIAVGHFLLNEFIVVPATKELNQWRAADYAMVDREMPPAPTDTWAIEDRTSIRVRAVTRNGTILDDIILYRKGPQGLLSAVVTADFAAFVDGQWTLFDVRTFDIASHRIETVQDMPWSTDLPPERFLALSLQRETISFFNLLDTAHQLQQEGQAVTNLVAWLNQKLAGPVSSLVMPILGALAAFGVYRGGVLFLRITAGAALGFAFFVVDNLLLALGQFGTLPPVLAAWAPVALFLCIGLGIIVFAEE